VYKVDRYQSRAEHACVCVCVCMVQRPAALPRRLAHSDVPLCRYPIHYHFPKVCRSIKTLESREGTFVCCQSSGHSDAGFRVSAAFTAHPAMNHAPSQSAAEHVMVAHGAAHIPTDHNHCANTGVSAGVGPLAAWRCCG